MSNRAVNRHIQAATKGRKAGILTILEIEAVLHRLRRLLNIRTLLGQRNIINPIGSTRGNVQEGGLQGAVLSQILLGHRKGEGELGPSVLGNRLRAGPHISTGREIAGNAHQQEQFGNIYIGTNPSRVGVLTGTACVDKGNHILSCRGPAIRVAVRFQRAVAGMSNRAVNRHIQAATKGCPAGILSILKIKGIAGSFRLSLGQGHVINPIGNAGRNIAEAGLPGRAFVQVILSHDESEGEFLPLILRHALTDGAQRYISQPFVGKGRNLRFGRHTVDAETEADSFNSRISPQPSGVSILTSSQRLDNGQDIFGGRGPGVGVAVSLQRAIAGMGNSAVDGHIQTAAKGCPAGILAILKIKGIAGSLLHSLSQGHVINPIGHAGRNIAEAGLPRRAFVQVILGYRKGEGELRPLILYRTLSNRTESHIRVAAVFVTLVNKRGVIRLRTNAVDAETEANVPDIRARSEIRCVRVLTSSQRLDNGQDIFGGRGPGVGLTVRLQGIVTGMGNCGINSHIEIAAEVGPAGNVRAALKIVDVLCRSRNRHDADYAQHRQQQ